MIFFLVGNPWTFGTESPDDTGEQKFVHLFTTILLRLKYVLPTGTCITRIGPWFYIRPKIDGQMCPVSMSYGDVTDFKNTVVLIHVV